MYSYKDKIPNITPNTKYIKDVDTDFLCQLFDFQTPTGDNKIQNQFLEWIVDNFIKRYNIPCVIERDGYGGMYITKGETDIYPCVVSHVDQVGRF